MRAAGLVLVVASPLSAASFVPAEANGVLVALEQYKAAYEALDVSRVADVLPSLVRADLDTIRRSFAGMTSYELEVRDVRADVQSDVATVDALVVRRMVPRVGRPVVNEVNTRFSLLRTGGRWIIARVTADLPVKR